MRTRVGRAKVPASSTSAFRSDIEGLRALAVALVVAHHLGWPGFGAGFIGVDVFFVISGFLIGGKLLEEIRATGTVDLVAFASRRAKRLLPLAATVIGTTLLLGFLVLNPMRWDGLLRDARAGALFFANEHFARTDGGYFATDVRESPFLHLWSLAVEEQFYVALPVALWLALALRRRGRSLELPTILIVSLCAMSVLAAVKMTEAGTTAAYFSLTSRGWELGAGVLLSFGWRWVGPRRGRLRGWMEFGGVALLTAGMWSVETTTNFPAWGALYPVVGTLLLLVAEPGTGSVIGRVLRAGPVRAVGRWSYGWYLWHWPLLVLGREVLGDGAVVSAALVVLALLVSAVTHRFVEEPARTAVSRTRPALLVGATALVVSLGAIQLGVIASDQYFSQPDREQLRAASQDYLDITAGCISVDAAQLLESCSTSGTRDVAPVLLYGDSHLSHWRPALEAAATSLGVPTVRSILGNCFPYGDGQMRYPRHCKERVSGFETLLDDLRPSAVVVGTAGYGDLVVDGRVADDQQSALQGAVERLARSTEARGISLVMVLDTPRYQDWHPLECMAKHGPERRCSLSRQEELDRLRPVNDAIRAGIAAAGHGLVFDTFDITCPDDWCTLVEDDVVVPQDQHHVTVEWAATKAPVFRELLGPLLPLAADARPEVTPLSADRAAATTGPRPPGPAATTGP